MSGSGPGPARRVTGAAACLALWLWAPGALLPADERDGWIPLFDGATLAGWQASDSPASFRVVDGAIACDGPRAHLFYVGPDGRAAFEDFEAEAEVRTRPGANSGFYFHTAFQAEGWPAEGFEVQVNNSQPRRGDSLELKKTGSLYGIRNVYKALAKDDEWFTLRVTVRKPRVEVRVNDTLVVDWSEPPGPLPSGAAPYRLGRGTFALQCHDPESKVLYRRIRVRPLPSAPASAAAAPAAAPPGSPVVDDRYLRMLALGRANFPLVDLHADSMTWTNPAGRRMRLWMPEEVEIGPDVQAFMDQLVTQTVGILETEPIDVYVNPTFLPAAISARYDELWTEERMTRVIDAAVGRGVAIEINGRYKLPSERFLRLAKRKGARFTFGTNNTGASDFGDWSYPLEMQRRLGLEWRDMFVPGYAASRAQRE